MASRSRELKTNNLRFKSLSIKNIKISERVGVQLRAEAFNVFNHSNLYIVGASAEVNNGFVQATKGVASPFSPAERRNIQLAARFTF